MNKYYSANNAGAVDKGVEWQELAQVNCSIRSGPPFCFFFSSTLAKFETYVLRHFS